MSTIGKLVQELTPHSGNPRNSEGAFLALKDGRILFAYSRFHGKTWSDGDSCDIAAIYSHDNGDTWDNKEGNIIKNSSALDVDNIMSVSLVRMGNEDVGLYYLVKERNGCVHCVLSRSEDEGETYYKTIRCTESLFPGYYVVNNDRVERLSDGRIVIPAALHRSYVPPHETEKTLRFDAYSTVHFFVSEDDGETYTEANGRIDLPHTAHSCTGLQEPGLVELQNGVLWAYARTDCAYQYESFSLDGMNSWTPAQPSVFTSPPSPMKIKRNPATGILYAVWNPCPNYNGRILSNAGWGRTPLVIAKSGDDGKNWSNPTVIEDNPDCGYCYPALFFTEDDSLLLAYCNGGTPDKACLSRLGIRKIPLSLI